MYSFENLPSMPLTLEGASLLHQMLRIRWAAWRALPAVERAQILQDASAAFTAMEASGSGVFSPTGTFTLAIPP